MSLKITLITPPDIFQNLNPSILLMNLDEKQQDRATEVLGKIDIDLNLNIYFYQGETNIPWILHALSTCEYKYINLDNSFGCSEYLYGYILAKPQVYYSVSDPNLKNIYSFINQNCISDIDEFLQRVLHE